MSSSSAESHSKLGEFLSTAICGNDILSSALYVAGIASLFAGLYAPLVLLAVGLVLFFYRSVYREVVEALPVNGGAYNALLNSTSKTFAAIAGIMTLLSYIATAVISAKTAVEYLFQFLDRFFQARHLPLPSGGFSAWILPIVAIVLLIFALLVIAGVKDSARVAAGIFSFHILTLCLFVGIGLWVLLGHSTMVASLNVVATRDIVAAHGGLLKTLFLAFSASLLGVSGFESSANFVEEQKHGVFAKTLRNMTFGVIIFNPLIAYVILHFMPLPSIIASKDFLLAAASFQLGGMLLLGIIAIDAFFVLCGAVLTSYIGVTGLMKRLTLDACLPDALLNPKNPESSTRIVLVFFGLCLSILFLTQGDLLSLAGVYTISFLGVMTLFAIGNLILRKNRAELQRPYRGPLAFVLIAAISTLTGLMGNIAIDPRNTGFFLTYFIPAAFIVFGVIYRRDAYAILKRTFRFAPPLARFFERKYHKTRQARIVVFIHHIDRLYHILNYISRNENGTHITLVHCNHGHANLADKLQHSLTTLREAGFFKDFTYEVEYLPEAFSPAVLDRYARHHRVPKNTIFMGSIHHSHEFTYKELGGVRIIF